MSDLLELLANGASVEELLVDYPCLEREDILAAIVYAARLGGIPPTERLRLPV